MERTCERIEVEMNWLYNRVSVTPLMDACS